MDPEIQAMAAIATALDGLDAEAARRVLKWASERFQVRLAGSGSGVPRQQTSNPDLPVRAFADQLELFDAANPQTGLDRVMAIAYWHQVVRGQEDWDSQLVNADLKNLGHPSRNITRDLDSLIKRAPRLVMQVRKAGSHRQARKRYRLTREGIRVVENMLNASAESVT